MNRLTLYRDPLLTVFRSLLDDQSSLGQWSPRLDLEEDEKSYSLSVDLPDVDKQDLRVSLENRMLTIAGEKKNISQSELEQADSQKTFHRVERSWGKFSRSIYLEKEVDPDSIEAHLDRGVLRLRVPKAQSSRSRKIEVLHS